jgi:hypothetical protein
LWLSAHADDVLGLAPHLIGQGVQPAICNEHAPRQPGQSLPVIREATPSVLLCEQRISKAEHAFDRDEVFVDALAARLRLGLADAAGFQHRDQAPQRLIVRQVTRISVHALGRTGRLVYWRSAAMQ